MTRTVTFAVVKCVESSQYKREQMGRGWWHWGEKGGKTSHDLFGDYVLLFILMKNAASDQFLFWLCMAELYLVKRSHI